MAKKDDNDLPDKYLNPFTDYGFKKLFGEPVNKALLIDFLNELLKEEQGEIKKLTYLKTEHLGSTETDRKAIFDLYCENQRGEKFIVELQKTKQNFFKDRALYYATFPIQEQAKRGTWSYELKAVYTVGILDFIFDEDKADPDKYRYDVKLTDQDTQKVFYDKLTFIYLEMPKFTKSPSQLKTRFDKWLYVLANLSRLQHIPDVLREKIFEQVFETAEIARFTPEQRIHYEDSLKYYRDLKNSLDTAFDEGKAEGIEIGERKGIEIGEKKGIAIGEKKGREEGKAEGVASVAKRLITAGHDDVFIVQVSGLSIEEVQMLRQKLDDNPH